MVFQHAHSPAYGYMKGFKHTIPLHLVHYARTFSIFKLLNKLKLGTVLNVGGADGYQSHLIQKIFGVDVVTLDIDEGMLAIAHNKFGLKTKLGSALDIPFDDNSFDTVICIETIEHIDNHKTVVSELKRVARSTVIISTESFFESEAQRDSFLLYLHETHPQFFRTIDPVTPSDKSHFTLDDFITLFGSNKLNFYPQFSHKQAEIVDDIVGIRSHVKSMTENITISRKTKIIVHYSKQDASQNDKTVPEEVLLQEIVKDTPEFHVEYDEEMHNEDIENTQRIQRWHEEKLFCNVIEAPSAPTLSIEEKGANGMSLQWLTSDDLERSPRFCVRKITLEPSGQTPLRNTSWEHQLYVLSGEGRLIENNRETPLHPDMVVHVRENISFKIENIGHEKFIYLDTIPSITHYFGR